MIANFGEALLTGLFILLYMLGVFATKIPLIGWLVGGFIRRPAVRQFNKLRRRHLARAASIADHDGRPAVLYLRSFLADAEAAADSTVSTELSFAFATEEEQLAKALEPLGPMLAIGKPGEPLPELGAQRAYYEDDKWQDAVRESLERCVLVVLRVGPTEHLFWEFEQARVRKSPEQVLLLVPERADEYDPFVARCEAAGIPMPASDDMKFKVFGGAGSLRGFVHFSAGWQPHYVDFNSWLSSPFNFRGRIRLPLYAVFYTGLKPVFASLGQAWKPIPWNRAAIGMLLGSLLFFSALWWQQGMPIRKLNSDETVYLRR